MASGAGLIAPIDALIDLFNRQGMDLPDGLFDRRTQFALNGTLFEEMLGRDPADPLVRMIARGPAGYRFAAKAVQHALPDARLDRGELEETADTAGPVVRGRIWLGGHLRDTGEAVDTIVEVDLRFTGTTVTLASARVDAGVLEKLKRARLSRD